MAQLIALARALSVPLAAALALVVGASAAASVAPRGAYAPTGATCDGYPRAPIGMAKGYCAGLVAGPPADFAARALRLPRTLLALEDGDWLVSDLGSWTTDRGAVWRLHAEPGKPPALKRLLSDLALPHTLARGPDGQIYLGEMNRISRLDLGAGPSRPSLIPVVVGLPANRLHEDRHPLSAFVFDKDGALLVNIGAPSDQCLDADGRRNGADHCAESEAAEAKAVIRRYAYLGQGSWDPAFTILARGLRNSVALVVHPSGTVLQGENSYDFDDRWSPFDEVNLIRPERHYGWPYCADLDRATPGWSGGMDCTGPAHERPALLLPPHAAPLAMTYYHGAMFPKLEGRLLMTWHGYRTTAGRLAAFRVDRTGVPTPSAGATYAVYGGPGRPFGQGPTQTAMVLTPGWNRQQGVRPQGAPVDVSVAPDGSIWLTDDKNAAIIRIAADRP